MDFPAGGWGAAAGSKAAGLTARCACSFPMRVDGSLGLNGARPDESWGLSRSHGLFALLLWVESGHFWFFKEEADWSFFTTFFFLVPVAGTWPS